MKNQRWELFLILFWPLLGIAIALFLSLVQALSHWIRPGQ